MAIKAELITARHIKCPECGAKEGGVDHLAPGASFGPWYCDGCGYGYTGKVLGDGSIEIEGHADRKRETLVLLKLPPQTHPVYLIVRGMRFGGEDGDEAEARDEYFYNEHTCPTNYLSVAEEVMVEDGVDPHGLFEYVAARPYEETNNPFELFSAEVSEWPDEIRPE